MAKNKKKKAWQRWQNKTQNKWDKELKPYWQEQKAVAEEDTQATLDELSRQENMSAEDLTNELEKIAVQEGWSSEDLANAVNKVGTQQGWADSDFASANARLEEDRGVYQQEEQRQYEDETRGAELNYSQRGIFGSGIAAKQEERRGTSRQDRLSAYDRMYERQKEDLGNNYARETTSLGLERDAATTGYSRAQIGYGLQRGAAQTGYERAAGNIAYERDAANRNARNTESARQYDRGQAKAGFYSGRRQKYYQKKYGYQGGVGGI